MQHFKTTKFFSMHYQTIFKSSTPMCYVYRTNVQFQDHRVKKKKPLLSKSNLGDYFSTAL